MIGSEQNPTSRHHLIPEVLLIRTTQSSCQLVLGGSKVLWTYRSRTSEAQQNHPVSLQNLLNPTGSVIRGSESGLLG